MSFIAIAIASPASFCEIVDRIEGRNKGTTEICQAVGFKRFGGEKGEIKGGGKLVSVSAGSASKVGVKLVHVLSPDNL